MPNLTVAKLDDLTAQCIRCGFCLESCPTYVETGQETESPRGRIYLVRSAEMGTIPLEITRPHLDACLGCRACETACPSGVEYGHILELARAKMGPDWKIRVLLAFLTKPRLLSLAMAIANALKLRQIWTPWGTFSLPVRHVPAETSAKAGEPKSPQQKNPPVAIQGMGTVEVLDGCAMRVLFPQVNAATRELIRAVGFSISDKDLGCCGALHAHGGCLSQGRAMAASTKLRARDSRLIVNSAGCGSWLKDAGANAVDLSEFLLENGMTELLNQAQSWPIRVTYHDACHLAHGQRITSAPRQLILAIPGIELIELPESDRCCGSAGIYNITQPLMASRLLSRKVENIRGTKAEIVVLANPGCHAYIESGLVERSSIQVLHLAEFLQMALNRLKQSC